MQCAQCDAELTDFALDDEHVFICPDCFGLWVDGSQLNSLLLHHSLAGIGSLGGRADPDAQTGTCKSCRVGLLRIEQAGRGDVPWYETCEDCGFVYVPVEGAAPTQFATACASLVSFFKRFSAR